MVFLKIEKKASYFSRFQVKPKRRRQCKTDYKQRRALCVQKLTDMDKKKYRMVVRITNKDIVCQIVEAQLHGDIIIESAYAKELTRYGIKVGFTNYAAAYCVGLLLARRILKKMKLDTIYQGVLEADGKNFAVEPVEDKEPPFYCILDIGLRRTTTGGRVFACLKGALDGGLDMPYSDNRFVGYNKETKTLDTEILRKFIYGGNVADYMELLKEENMEKYEKQFSQFIKNDIEPEDLEDIYREAHKKIRENPLRPPKKPKKPASSYPKSYKMSKLTREERKANLKKKIAMLQEQIEVDDE